MKLPKERFVVVVWNDASGSVIESVDYTNIDDLHKPSMMLTAGWILKSDEAGITLCSEACPGDTTFRGRSFIPAGMIVEVLTAKIQKAKQKPLPVDHPTPDESAPTQ